MLPAPDFSEHIDSFYVAGRNDFTRYPSPEHDMEVETCIIGGGLSGLGTALPLALSGHHVALIEAARIGFGASGRNGGQVISGWAAEMSDIAAMAGKETAKKLWDMSLEALALADRQIREYGIDCDRRHGYAHVAVKPRHLRDLEHKKREAEDVYGYGGFSLWSREELQERLGSSCYRGALFDTDSGHLHPLNYTLGLARAAAAAGARIYEHAPMRDIVEEKGGYRITTPRAVIRARNVVVAVNAFTSSLAPALLKPLNARILPVGTYIIATEPLGSRAAGIINNGMAVCDTRFVLDYYRLSADSRLLYGGRVNYTGREPDREQLIRSMRRDMERVFPQLAGIRIDYAWGGDVDITLKRTPDFGIRKKGLYFLQGFSGHGVAAAGIGGLAVAEAVLGDGSRLSVFEQLRNRNFPGGPLLRGPSQLAGSLYYRFKDMLP